MFSHSYSENCQCGVCRWFREGYPLEQSQGSALAANVSEGVTGGERPAHKTLPREPTDEMIQAGLGANVNACGIDDLPAVYRAMWDAARAAELEKQDAPT